MKIVLISGIMQNGKTTIANMLQEYFEFKSKLPYDIFRVSLAEPVKRIATEQFGWDGEKDEAGRKLLQDIASAGRQYDKDIWVRQAHQKILDQSVDFVIIDDWRYPNEFDYLYDKKFPIISIRVVRSDDGVILEDSTGHDSETALLDWENDDFQYCIQNDDTLSTLKKTIAYLGEVETEQLRRSISR